MEAAMKGKTATAKFLIEELKADKTLKDNRRADCGRIRHAVQPPNHLRRHRPGGGGQKGRGV